MSRVPKKCIFKVVLGITEFFFGVKVKTAKLIGGRIIRLAMYCVVQNNTVHFRPCHLMFLQYPLLYSVITLDSVNHGC